MAFKNASTSVNLVSASSEPQRSDFQKDYKPGEIIDSITNQDVNRALDTITLDDKPEHFRRLSLSISNEGPKYMNNPRHWTYTGHAPAVHNPRLERGQTSLQMFVKRDFLCSGTAGVFSYDIVNSGFKVAVMWSVPFDMNVWNLWYNVKIYPREFETGSKMFRKMYYSHNPKKPSGWENFDENNVKVRATMTQNIQAKLMVWVDTENLG